MTAAREGFCASGAAKLADKVREYWMAQGYIPPKVWVEQIPELPSVHVVRSDMINGMPRGGRVNAPSNRR
jgi:hypothetical protein